MIFTSSISSQLSNISDRLYSLLSSFPTSVIIYLPSSFDTIAFENDATDGWVTEKMPDAIRAYSIPIYYGDPGINNDFNEKAFINLADYDYDLDKLVQRVIELDNNDEEYLAMLREQPLSTKFQFDGNERFKNWIYSIIEKALYLKNQSLHPMT